MNVAVAIQLERAPSEKNPVYTPRDDPAAWLRAKVFFQVADLNFHELSTHLCRTHFGMETFVVAMGRQLVDSPAQPDESFAAVTLLYVALNLVILGFMRWVDAKSRVPGFIGGGGR